MVKSWKMVKDVPIPEEIFQEFNLCARSKKSVAQLFDNFDFCVLCDDQRIGKEMPSQSKGQNCIDKYFAKVNLNNSNNCVDEMGKKNSKNNSIHKLSSSSESEQDMVNSKNVSQNNLVEEKEDLNCKENIDFDRTPTKPIIAAMNALGKLKRGLSEVGVDDNSSVDSTALVIDEGQLESDKEQSDLQDEVSQGKIGSNRKSTANTEGSVENETLSLSPFFNPSRMAAHSTVIEKCSTSTPVEGSKSTKRKRISDAGLSDQPLVKKTKETESMLQSGYEDMESLNEIKVVKDDIYPLCMEDLDSEDEIYVVQCPKEVCLESLVGNQLELNGESTLKLNVKGEKRLYECFSQEDSLGRNVNMILPSRNEEIFKFGMYKLKGSIVVSESLNDSDLTDDTTIKDTSSGNTVKHSPSKSREISIEKNKKHKTKNEKYEEQAGQSLEEKLNTSKKGERSSDVQGNNTSCPVKKKKKRKDEENELASNLLEVHGLDLEKSDKKKKKVKQKEKNIEADQEQHPTEEIIIKKKKKKKHRDEAEEENEIVKEQQPTSLQYTMKEESLDVSPAASSITIKKKKKKKDKEKVEVSSNNTAERVAEPISIDEEPIKKKKKKKHQDQVLAADLQSVQPISKEDEPSINNKHKEHFPDEIRNLWKNQQFKLSSFTDEPDDMQLLKKKKKKKKKKEKEKSLD